MTASAHDQSAVSAFYTALEAIFRIASLVWKDDENDYIAEHWQLVDSRKARALNDFIYNYREFFTVELNDVPTCFEFQDGSVLYGAGNNDAEDNDAYFIYGLFATAYKLEPFNGKEIVLICDYYGDGSVVNKLTLRVQ